MSYTTQPFFPMLTFGEAAIAHAILGQIVDHDAIAIVRDRFPYWVDTFGEQRAQVMFDEALKLFALTSPMERIVNSLDEVFEQMPEPGVSLRDVDPGFYEVRDIHGDLFKAHRNRSVVRFVRGDGVTLGRPLDLDSTVISNYEVVRPLYLS
jgi:hypothetical protein